MKMIIICGIDNSGKSTALRFFYENYMRANDEFKILDEEPYEIDYKAIVEYKGKKIGIVSYGDLESFIQEGMKYTKGCDVAILAARTKGAGRELLRQAKCPQVIIHKGRFEVENGAISAEEIERMVIELAEETAIRIYKTLQLLIE